MTQDNPIKRIIGAEVVPVAFADPEISAHNELETVSIEPDSIDTAVTTPKPGTLVLLGVDTLTQRFDSSPERIITTRAQEIVAPYNALVQSLTPPVRENRFRDTLIDIVLANERTKRWETTISKGSLDTQYAYSLRYTKEPSQNVPSQLEVEIGSWLDNTALDSFESIPAAQLLLQFNHGQISDLELSWKAANPATVLGLANQTDAGQFLATFMQKYFAIGNCGDTTSRIKLHLGEPSIELFQQVGGYFVPDAKIFDYADITSEFELASSGPEVKFQRIIEDLPAHQNVKRVNGISLEENLSVNEYYTLLNGLLSLLPTVVHTWQAYPQIGPNKPESDLR